MHFPVTFDIQPSRRLRVALFFAHLAALLALLSSGIDRLVLLASASVLAASLLRAWRLSPPARLRLGQDGGLSRIEAVGDGERLELLPGAVVFSWLVVMRVRDEGGRSRSQVVLADSLAPGEFRMLRIWLRWQAKFRSSAEPV